MLSVRSFRSRVLLFVVGLLALVQGAALLAVHLANVSGARRHIGEALGLTAASFRRSLDARERILLEKTRLLSADFAFKQVVATRDRATLLSALQNHRGRIGADLMMLLELNGAVVADTLHPAAEGVAAPILPVLSRARENEYGEASSIQSIDGVPYQIVVVPFFNPEPSAWIVMGFAIRDSFARELQKETGTDVSLLQREGDGWHPLCSTLDAQSRRDLAREIAVRPRDAARRVFDLDLAGERYVTWVAPLDAASIEVAAVLQRSLDEALKPFLELRTGLLLIFVFGLGVSLLGSALLANRVTRPVAVLAEAARRIGRGDYSKPVVVAQQDELGLLATSFNAMTRGLAERDRVRDLLGRVVAPEVAEELLSHEIELGGEERNVSVFFTDIRSFTNRAEREDPQRLVQVLNLFLTGVSRAVEEHDGVVDEYLGDGAKAVFGAPIAREDHAERAVRAALALRDSLPGINAEIEHRGDTPLAVGIGINTANVIAGRMGSLARLKYTVIGDGVNVAARLESLTKRYRVPIIASDSTADRCSSVVFRELDRVRVQGRKSPITIYEPLATTDALAERAQEQLARHHAALARFRARDWTAARVAFAALLEADPETRLYAHYLDRLHGRSRTLPLPDEDGITTIDEK